MSGPTFISGPPIPLIHGQVAWRSSRVATTVYAQAFALAGAALAVCRDENTLQNGSRPVGKRISGVRVTIRLADRKALAAVNCNRF